MMITTMAQTHFENLPKQLWVRNILPYLSQNSLEQFAQVSMNAHSVLHHPFVVTDFKKLFPSDYRYLQETDQLDKISMLLLRKTWQYYFGKLSAGKQELLRAIYNDDLQCVQHHLTKMGIVQPINLISKMYAIKDATGKSGMYWVRQWQSTNVLTWYTTQVENVVKNKLIGLNLDDKFVVLQLGNTRKQLLSVLRNIDDCAQYFPVERILRLPEHVIQDLLKQVVQSNNQSLLEDLIDKLPVDRVNLSNLSLEAITVGNHNALEFILPEITITTEHIIHALKKGDPLIVRILLSKIPLAKKNQLEIMKIVYSDGTNRRTDALKEFLKWLRIHNKVEIINGSDCASFGMLFGKKSAMRTLVSFGVDVHSVTPIERVAVKFRTEHFSYACRRELLPLYNIIHKFAPRNAAQIFGALHVTSIEQLYKILADAKAFLDYAPSNIALLKDQSPRPLKVLKQLREATKAFDTFSRFKLRKIRNILGRTLNNNLDKAKEHEFAEKAAAFNPIKLNLSSLANFAKPEDAVQQKYILLKTTFNKRNRVGRIFIACLSGIWQEHQQLMRSELITDDMDAYSIDVINAKRSAALNDMRILQHYYDYLVSGNQPRNQNKLKSELKDMVQRRTRSLTNKERSKRLVSIIGNTALFGIVLLFLFFSISPILFVLYPTIGIVCATLLTTLYLSTLAIEATVYFKNRFHKSPVGQNAAKIAKLTPSPKMAPLS